MTPQQFRLHEGAVQFLENSVMGLRAAAYELVHAERSDTVVLLPMVHIGTPDYYEDVMQRLSGCTPIVFEGLRTRSAWLLAKSYKLVARRRSLGLVTQQSALNLKATGAKLVHADISPEEFSRSWQQIPKVIRGAIAVAGPLY